MKSSLVFAALILSFAGLAQNIRTLGVMVNVTDLDAASVFYCDKLGFAVKSTDAEHIFLESGDENILVLHKVSNLVPEMSEARAGLSLQVNDLDKTIARLKEKGVSFGNEQKRKEGVGFAIYILDPFGKKVSLIQQTVGTVAPFREPRIYNYGFTTPDMDKSIDFYTNVLGFVVRSRKYLPSDMPLGHADGTFGFMLHFREGTEPVAHHSIDSEHVVLLFRTTNIDSTMADLRTRGVRFLQKNPRPSVLGRSISFFDPFGYLSEITETKK